MGKREREGREAGRERKRERGRGRKGREGREGREGRKGEGRGGGRKGKGEGEGRRDCFLTFISIINSYYKELSNGTVVSVQKGVCRTNCIDCLDRYSILTIY